MIVIVITCCARVIIVILITSPVQVDPRYSGDGSGESGTVFRTFTRRRPGRYASY
eukprot:jgi/Mesvir1/17747/Mv25316-RA.1